MPASYRWRRLQGKCNRNKPPARVRMERRGKSSPLLRQRGRPCKPHSMQETRTDRSPAASLNRLSPAATLGSDRCLSSTEPGLQTALANIVPHHFRCGTFLSFTEPLIACISSNYFSRLSMQIYWQKSLKSQLTCQENATTFFVDL